MTDFAGQMVTVGDTDRLHAAQTATQRARFTPSGWDGFQHALSEAGIPHSLAQNGLVMAWRVTGPGR